MSHQRLSDRLCIDIGPFGRALKAMDHIAEGEIIIGLEGRMVDVPNRYTIQVGEGRHLEPDGHGWALINHSCRPNARVDLSASAMVATKDIAPGDEITFNYLTTERVMAEPFHCGCGAPHCPGAIAGFDRLSREQKLALRPYLSEFLAGTLDAPRPERI